MMRLINNNKGRQGVLVLLLLMVAAEFMRSSVGTLAVVEGVSMYPTLKPNDVVQARTSYAGWERGSVVIIRDDQGDDAIKRIVALPGETVTIFKGFVFINRQKLHEPYLVKHTYTYKPSDKDERAVAWHLDDNEYFVLGDNRFASYDSRNYGPVKRRQINRVVNLPENSVKPGFSGIILSETGKITPGKHSDHGPDRKRLRNANYHSNAKI